MFAVQGFLLLDFETIFLFLLQLHRFDGFFSLSPHRCLLIYQLLTRFLKRLSVTVQLGVAFRQHLGHVHHLVLELADIALGLNERLFVALAALECALVVSLFGLDFHAHPLGQVV